MTMASLGADSRAFGDICEAIGAVGDVLWGPRSFTQAVRLQKPKMLGASGHVPDSPSGQTAFLGLSQKGRRLSAPPANAAGRQNKRGRAWVGSAPLRTAGCPPEV